MGCKIHKGEPVKRKQIGNFIMEYGWIFLIIIVILGALYSIGAFSQLFDMLIPATTSDCEEVCAKANATYYRTNDGTCECLDFSKCLKVDLTKTFCREDFLVKYSRFKQ